MRLPPRPVRRACLPAVVVLLAVLACLSAAGALLSVLLVPLTTRPLRAAAFATGYLLLEIAGLAAAGLLWLRRPRLGPWSLGDDDGWDAANQSLLTLSLSLVLRLARRCFGYRIEVEDPAPAQLAGGAPVIVLARHAGPGDSFSVAHLLLSLWRRRVRIVLRDLLQVDPVLDVLLNRLGCCFLSGDEADPASRVGELAAGLSGRDALLLFPEGGNWTPDRRRRAIRHLHAEGKREAARAGALMSHVLPPRPAGALAALDARPELAVVLVAHAGLDRLVTVRDAWAAVPLRRPMTVRAWPAAPAPEEDGERVAWLTTEWATVDEWVDAHRPRPATA